MFLPICPKLGGHSLSVYFQVLYFSPLVKPVWVFACLFVFAFCYLKQHLSLDLELTVEAMLTGQQAPGTLPPLSSLRAPGSQPSAAFCYFYRMLGTELTLP